MVARAFVEHYASSGAVLLTPRDLSRKGWLFRMGDPESSVAIASGQRLAARDIGGVMTRLPGIGPDELTHIAEEDRAYVAAEMTAFLLAFLSSLKVRVANSPTPLCLCGPCWRAEKWARLANGLGIRVAPVRRRAVPGEDAAPAPAGSVATIVGTRFFGAVDPALAGTARTLARTARADFLAVVFDGAGAEAALLGASPQVDLADADIAAAAFALFGQPGRRPEQAGAP